MVAHLFSVSKSIGSLWKTHTLHDSFEWHQNDSEHGKCFIFMVVRTRTHDVDWILPYGDSFKNKCAPLSSESFLDICVRSLQFVFTLLMRNQPSQIEFWVCVSQGRLCISVSDVARLLLSHVLQTENFFSSHVLWHFFSSLRAVNWSHFNINLNLQLQMSIFQGCRVSPTEVQGNYLLQSITINI